MGIIKLTEDQEETDTKNTREKLRNTKEIFKTDWKTSQCNNERNDGVWDD